MDDALTLPPRITADNAGIADSIAAHGPRLRSFVRRQVADLADVDDIVQDTFLELVAAYRLAQPIEHLAAWLVRVARNRIVDRFRSRARWKPARSGPALADSDPDDSRVLEDWLAPAASGPDATYAREILVDELLAALEELPAEQRDAFLAHEIDGRSFRELARETGVPLNTLLGRKHSAVRHLRQRLNDIGSELDT